MKVFSCRKMTRMLLAILPGILLVSCVHRKGLTGRWQEVGTTAIIEFHRDGSFNAVDDMGMAVSGKYALRGSGNIRFEIIQQGSTPESIEGKMNLKGDELVLISPDNVEIERYRRIK